MQKSKSCCHQNNACQHLYDLLLSPSESPPSLQSICFSSMRVSQHFVLLFVHLSPVSLFLLVCVFLTLSVLTFAILFVCLSLLLVFCLFIHVTTFLFYSFPMVCFKIKALLLSLRLLQITRSLRCYFLLGSFFYVFINCTNLLPTYLPLFSCLRSNDDDNSNEDILPNKKRKKYEHAIAV